MDPLLKSGIDNFTFNILIFINIVMISEIQLHIIFSSSFMRTCNFKFLSI